MKKTAKITALTSPVTTLTEQQRIFAEAVVKGNSPMTAARLAGYSQPKAQGGQIMQSKAVQDAIKFLYKKNESVSDMTRKKVMDGMLEAIDMARMQADSGVMVAGWREIGRMCGYYAPEVKKIDINVTTKRVIDRLETMSDDDLLQLVDESSRTIEMEAVEVLETLQQASDAEEDR
jgi:phage terminase small subunit